MAPPEWSDAGYRNREHDGAGISSSNASATAADDRCMVVIEQLMCNEAG
jgi:hypothetical protein